MRVVVYVGLTSVCGWLLDLVFLLLFWDAFGEFLFVVLFGFCLSFWLVVFGFGILFVLVVLGLVVVLLLLAVLLAALLSVVCCFGLLFR